MISLKNNKLNILFLSGLLSLASCSEHSSDDVSDEYVRYMDYIPVSMATRATGDGDMYQDVSPYEDDLLDDAFKDKISVLYLSQLARGLTPFDYFENQADDGDTDSSDPTDPSDPTDTSDPSDPSDPSQPSGPNLNNVYQYTFEKREKYPNPTWDDQFNFFPQNENDMVDWEVVRSNGSYGNGFTLYGLYFPHSQNYHLEVKQDQSTLENLQISNILGAYHSTSSLYTRLRFRLFHLMVYLKVNVYIPVFKTEVDDNGENKISGFAADALQSVELMNAYPKFSINWTADRSSDTEAPLTTLRVAEEEKPVDIKMYKQYPAGDAMPEKAQIPMSSYDPNVTDPEKMDDVWVYTYHVLFPAQDANYASSNFLRFKVRNNVGNVIKNYVFNGSQFVGTGQLQLNQGNMQTLDLYLPRDAGEAVLVQADVLDWTFTNSDMHVSQDKNGTID